MGTLVEGKGGVGCKGRMGRGVGHFITCILSLFLENGFLFIQEVVNTGLFHMRSTCRRCHGQGTIITAPCVECQGKGTKTVQQTIDVSIPAG